MDEISKSCAAQWDGRIMELYENLRFNPENGSHYDIVAACLVRNGLVSEPFTGRDYMLWLEDAGLKYPDDDPRGATAMPPLPSVEPTLPGGTTGWDSDEVSKCINDPMLGLERDDSRQE